jgi:hypothetical protein
VGQPILLWSTAGTGWPLKYRRQEGVSSGTGLLATDEKFIHLNTAREFFPLLANSAASEFLQPMPGRLIAAEAQELLLNLRRIPESWIINSRTQ